MSSTWEPSSSLSARGTLPRASEAIGAAGGEEASARGEPRAPAAVDAAGEEIAADDESSAGEASALSLAAACTRAAALAAALAAHRMDLLTMR